MGDYRVFDGTDWVSPCNREIHFLSTQNVFELIDPKTREIHYYDGNTWQPMNCQCQGCPDGFTFNYDKQVCEQFQTPTFNGNILTLVKSATNLVFGLYGLTLYPSFGLITSPAIPLPLKTNGIQGSSYQVLDGTNAPVTALVANVNSDLWGYGTTASGRLNKIGLWTNTTTLDQSIVSFEVCLNITEEKEYIFAFAADNFFQCDIDVNTTSVYTTIVDFTQMSGSIPPDKNFKMWHAFPIILPAGNHLIKLWGKNDISACAFAAEIYNLDLATFQSTFANTTPPLAQEADLAPYIYFTTEKFINLQVVEPGTLIGEYTCPSGTTFDACRGVPVCVLETECTY